MGGFEGWSGVERSMAAGAKGAKQRLRVLVVRGSFAALGGAERELLQLLRNVDQALDALGWRPSKCRYEAVELLGGSRGHECISPQHQFNGQTGAWAEVTASASKARREGLEKDVEIPFACLRC